MKSVFASIFSVIITFMIVPGAYPQQVVVSSCNDATGVNGSVSYSTGQVFFLEKTGAAGAVLEGIQQPFEIFDVTGTNDVTGITLECSVFPNPAGEYVKMKVEKPAGRKLACEVYDLKGLRIRSVETRDEETVIPMDDLTRSTYLVTVTENGRVLKTFKIIKK